MGGHGRLPTHVDPLQRLQTLWVTIVPCQLQRLRKRRCKNCCGGCLKIKMVLLLVRVAAIHNNWILAPIFETTCWGVHRRYSFPPFLKSCVLNSSLLQQKKCLSPSGSERVHFLSFLVSQPRKKVYMACMEGWFNIVNLFCSVGPPTDFSTAANSSHVEVTWLVKTQVTILCGKLYYKVGTIGVAPPPQKL